MTDMRRITWTGPDQYTTVLVSGSLLRAGETYVVPADVAGPWIREGWAREADRPREGTKKSKASDKE